MTTPLRFTLECTIQPLQTFTYLNLPFEVPKGVGRIDVAYTYDGAIGSDPGLTGGNTLDIGIIDPRGSQFLTQGFRGWSGSARQHFYLATDSATPGYLAEPIQMGTWHICLGIYKVAPQGCQCRVDITLTPDATPLIESFPAMLAVETIAARAPNPDNWYKGELHCHTLHSDGDSTVPEVLAIAEALDLDFLAITDHNNWSHLVDLASQHTALTLIPGYEVTTYYGHWNIWGLADWIDFRVQSPDDLQLAIQTAQAQGYLVSCNHPRPYGPDWAFPEVAGFSCVEVWNGPWEVLNDYCLAFWTQRLNAGQRLVAVGGSDFHFSKEVHIAHIGHPTLFIHCPEVPSAANLLKHLRAGHAFISESPTGPRLDLCAGSAQMGDSVSDAPFDCSVTVIGGAGSELQLFTADGQVAAYPVSQDEQRFSYKVDSPMCRYVRAQLYDPSERKIRALTNPVYIEAGEAPDK